MADRQCAGARRAACDPGGRGDPLDRATTAPILVSGYYGLGNLGDEAVLAGLLSGLRDRYPAARVVALSGDPAATARMHAVEAWPRGPRDVWRALRGARLLISGGGSLVQDVTSARSAVYYAGTMLAAAARGVPVAVLGQGIGPLRRPWVRWLAARAFRRAAAVSVRDDASGRLLHDLGVRQPVVRGADLAFLLPVPPDVQGERLLIEAGAAARRPRVGLALRPWPDLADPAGFGRAVREGGGHVVGLSFDRGRDTEMTRRAADAASGVVVDAVTPQDLLAAVSGLDAVVAVRLHALIFAAKCGVPALAVAYDPKVRAFADEIGCPWVPASASLRAIAEACAALMAQRAAHRERLAAALPRLESLAAESLESVRPWA